MIRCDLCGSADPARVLESSRLDGPLVRCRQCGLYYVGERRLNLAFGSSDSAAATTDRIREANRDLAGMDLDQERRLAALNARTRLDLIRTFQPSGNLLEVGCARGDFLRVAKEHFNVVGVEPNPELAHDAMAFAPVDQGVIESHPYTDYDVAATFHVIEHTDSPRQFLEAIADRVRPGGLVVVETPNIHSLPFRLFRSRWRQFIPEHYFFFDEHTIARLMENAGINVERIARIGKFASPSLVLNRLGRYFRPLRYAERLADRLKLQRVVIPVDPFDILIAIGRKRDRHESTF